MARRSSTSSSGTDSSGTKTKKTRQKKVRTFVAHLAGEDNPTIVIANTQKDAITALLRLREASSQDLFNAGAKGYNILDLTKPQDVAGPVQEEASDGPYPRVA